jgi:hypothetical protein
VESLFGILHLVDPRRSPQTGDEAGIGCHSAGVEGKGGCWIAVLLGALVGFITMGLQRTLCPEEAANSSRRLSRVGKTDSEYRGWFFLS